MAEKRPGRRWFTMSLRLFLLLVLIIAVGLGWVVRQAKIQRDAVAVVVRGGGYVRYDWDTLIPRDRKVPITRGVGHPAAPGWLVSALGVDYFGSVRAVSIGQEEPDETLAAVANLPGLWQLDTINRARFTATGLGNLKGLPQLWRLNLPRTQLTKTGLRAISRLPAIEMLNVNHLSDLSDDDMADLAAWPNLKFLALGCPRVTDAGVEHLGSLTSLTTLDIGPCQMSSFGLRTVGKLKQLEILRLRKTNIHDIDSISGLDKLIELSIYGSMLTDRCLAPLSSLRGLKQLSLTDSRIKDTEVVHIRTMPNITTLDLSGTSITDDGLLCLGDLKNLTRLTIRRTRVTLQGMADLKKILPGLQVIN